MHGLGLEHFFPLTNWAGGCSWLHIFLSNFVFFKNLALKTASKISGYFIHKINTLGLKRCQLKSCVICLLLSKPCIFCFGRVLKYVYISKQLRNLIEIVNWERYQFKYFGASGY